LVFRTLYHEGFHQFLFNRVSANVPLWLNEGFAEYFAEATWNGKRFTTGQVPWERLRVLKNALRGGTHIPLGQLFAMRSEEWLASVRADDNQAPVQYCEVWSVVHFLLHAKGGRYRDRALGYLRLISEGMDHDEAFLESFGSNVDGFERAWRQYVMALESGPDDICRKNMEVIAFLALRYYGDLGRFTSLERLRRDLLDSEGFEWHVTTGDGEKISGKDKQRVMALFKCPYDRSGAPVSYVLLKNLRTGRPELYCTHHAGIVMKAYYVAGAEPGREVEVERIVRATLPRELAKELESPAGR
jgi:hypothetical protein